jgi:hypothetical protein
MQKYINFPLIFKKFIIFENLKNVFFIQKLKFYYKESYLRNYKYYIRIAYKKVYNNILI